MLAGGASRRMGGADKTALRVGGRALLDRAVAALAAGGADRVVVVGPRPPATAPPGVEVVLTREDPAGSGPVAGLAAGLALTTAPEVVVLAADLPRVDGAAVRALHAQLVAAAADAEAVGRPAGPARAWDAVVPVDGDGRAQWLLAAYRAGALRAAVAAALRERPVVRGARGAAPRGPGLKAVAARLTWTAATGAALSGRLADVDTPEQLSRAHLDAWTVGLAARWGLEPQLTDLLDDPERLVAEVLDVAKDAAHTVARPAAPLTTFLLGVALAARGAGSDAPRSGDLAALRAELEEALGEHRDARGDADPGR